MIMCKLVVSRSGIVSAAVTLTLIFAVFGIGPAIAQEGYVESQTAFAPAPQIETMEVLEKPPSFTAEQRARLEYWSANTSLPGPALDYNNAAEPGGPVPGTESFIADERTRSGQPLAAGDVVRMRTKKFGGTIPAGYKSNVMECSVGVGGRYAFYTGNWFAARSEDGGSNWTYVNPASGYPDFCCDQRAIYDSSYSRYIWLRMAVPDGNGENTFRLSVNTSWTGTVSTWYVYDFAPTDLNASWTNEWFDYPGDMQIGADYLYFSWNMFSQAGVFQRSVMFRIPLEDLVSGSGFAYDWYSTDWFTLVPVQGAYHTMYFASNWPHAAPQNNRLRIWRWDEDAVGMSYWTRTVASAWTLTGRGNAQCGTANGNWCDRGDQRLQTGARYSINSDGGGEDRIRGRKVVGWWWNVGEGDGFSQPYTDAAAFFEYDMTQVGGYLGRPYVYGSWCFWYPSVTPNKRQDLGMVIHVGDGGDMNPNAYFAIADDYVSAPPGWVVTRFARSNARPSDEKWGDYNTVREFEPSEKVWVGAAHIIPGSTDCTACSIPVYTVFGRERDYWSWHRWRNK